jgi:hypothetical protein
LKPAQANSSLGGMAQVVECLLSKNEFKPQEHKKTKTNKQKKPNLKNSSLQRDWL